MRTAPTILTVLLLLLCAPAYAVNVPDTPLVTGPGFQQIPAPLVVITPVGGSQTTLGAALAAGCPKTGCTFTGPLHMGTNLLDGSNIAFTGGTLNGVTIGATTPGTGAFTGLGASGAVSLGTANTNWWTINGTNGAVAPEIALAGAAGSPNARIKILDNGVLNFATPSRVLAQIVDTGGSGTITSAGTGQLSIGLASIGGGGTITQSGSSISSKFLPLNVNINSSGTNTAGGFLPLNRILVGSDTLAFTGQSVDALLVSLSSGGSGATGNRSALHTDLTISGLITGGNQQYVSALSTASSAVNLGGTSPHSGFSAGTLFGANPNVILRNGATDWTGLIGEEIDVAIATGASAQQKTGVQIIKTTSDRVTGSDQDIAFLIADQSNANIPAWGQVVSFGGVLQQWPADTNSTLISATPQDGTFMGAIGSQLRAPLAANGVSFEKVVFSGSSINVPGVSISGTGTINAGGLVISTSGATSVIDADASTLTAAAVSTGGSDYYVNDYVNGPNGSILEVTSTNNGSGPGVVTGISIIVAGHTSSTPSNPVSFANGSGSGLKVNLTWTAATTISLNPTGGAILMAGLPTSAPATHCMLWVNSNVINRTPCP